MCRVVKNAVGDAPRGAVLCDETHHEIYLAVTSRKTDRKKNPARAGGREHTEMHTYHKLGPLTRRREPRDQRDMVGREFLGRQPVAQLF